MRAPCEALAKLRATVMWQNGVPAVAGARGSLARANQAAQATTTPPGGARGFVRIARCKLCVTVRCLVGHTGASRGKYGGKDGRDLSGYSLLTRSRTSVLTRKSISP